MIESEGNMERGGKEKWLGIAGLGIALAGAVWFGLAVASDILQGLVRVFGLPFGAVMVIVGLTLGGNYLWWWRRIVELTGGKNLLAQWNDDEHEVFIAADCAYIDGNLHLWSGLGARLEKVALTEEELYGSTVTNLYIEYSHAVQRRNLFGGHYIEWKSNELSLRIPPDKITAARELVDKLQENTDATSDGRTSKLIFGIIAALVVLLIAFVAVYQIMVQGPFAKTEPTDTPIPTEDASIRKIPAAVPIPSEDVKAALERDLGLACKAGGIDDWGGHQLAYTGWRCTSQGIRHDIVVQVFCRRDEPEKTDMISVSMMQQVSKNNQNETFMTAIAALALPEAERPAARQWMHDSFPALNQGSGNVEKTKKTNLQGVAYLLKAVIGDLYLQIGNQK
jgi:hypothetical protein